MVVQFEVPPLGSLLGDQEISSIPTLMSLGDRTVLYSQPGALPPQALEELIDRIRAVDMDDVRRQAADSTAAH
ncbi:hypothetical protein ACIPIU_04435 [Streptomyces massasporeus]|uniref:hypothetical protein n=1 Tax=Streptomyces massasporeus TaxID=67324 RepID=UPI00382D1376